MTMQQWLKTTSKCWKNINNKVFTSELLESKSFRSLVSQYADQLLINQLDIVDLQTLEH
jgi:hypothetical protein